MKNNENRGFPNEVTSAANTATERLLQIVTEKGLTPTSFYAKSGIGKGTLDKKGGLTSNTMEKIIAMYPDIDLFWLITGKKKPELRKESKPGDPTELLDAYRKVMDLARTIESKDQEIKDLEEELNIKDAKIFELSSIVKDLENRLNKYETKVS